MPIFEAMVIRLLNWRGIPLLALIRHKGCSSSRCQATPTKGEKMWYLVILDRTVLGVFGKALQLEALKYRDEIVEGTNQIAAVVTSTKRFHVGERLPANTKIMYQA